MSKYHRTHLNGHVGVTLAMKYATNAESCNDILGSVISPETMAGHYLDNASRFSALSFIQAFQQGGIDFIRKQLDNQCMLMRSWKYFDALVTIREKPDDVIARFTAKVKRDLSYLVTMAGKKVDIDPGRLAETFHRAASTLIMSKNVIILYVPQIFIHVGRC
jgi:hypothetical protein